MHFRLYILETVFSVLEKSRKVLTRKNVIIAGAVLLCKARPQNTPDLPRGCLSIAPSGLLRVGVVSKANSWTALPPLPSPKAFQGHIESSQRICHQSPERSLRKFHLRPAIRRDFIRAKVVHPEWKQISSQVFTTNPPNKLKSVPSQAPSIPVSLAEVKHHTTGKSSTICQKRDNIMEPEDGFFSIHLASKQVKYWVGLISFQLAVLIQLISLVGKVLPHNFNYWFKHHVSFNVSNEIFTIYLKLTCLLTQNHSLLGEIKCN